MPHTNDRTPPSSSRPPFRLRLLAAALAVCVLMPAPPAFAVRLKSDYVGGERATSHASPKVGLLPDVSMPSGILVTADGRELWAREPDQERAMASTTKMMTAMVVLEETDLEDRVRVSDHAVRTGESEAGLVKGETYSVEQLLEAMLIKSGNDAAVALAEHVSKGIPAFAKLMEAKADELDLDHTDLKNPTGLDQEGHHSSARDLASLARYAMRDPVFRRIVGTKKGAFHTSNGSFSMKTSNLLLGKYRGANGIKTGWTDEAGYCLVASAKRGDVELIAVVLGTSNETTRFEQAKKLLDWGFKHYAVREVTRRGEVLGSVPVSDYLDVSVSGVVGETTSVAQFDLAGEVTEKIDMAGAVEAPVASGQKLGTLTVAQGDRLLAQVPIVSAEAVEEPTFWKRVEIFFVRAWRRLTG